VGGAGAIGTLQGTTSGLQGNITLQGSAKVVFDQTDTGSYSGNMIGTGSLSKSNTGTVFLMGTNTYTGGTTGNGGVLVANSTSSLPGYNVATKVTANSGGAIGVSAGGAGQWSVTNIDDLRNISTFNNGSSVAFNVDTGNNFTYPTNIAPANSVGLIKLGAGTLTLSGTNSYSGGTTVTGGTLAMVNTFRTSASLSVSDGAKAALTPRTGSPDMASSRKTLQVGTLSLNTTGALDLADNDLVVNSGAYTTIRAYVLQGLGVSTTGIDSSTSTGGTRLAVFDNAVLPTPFASWNGGTVPTTAIIGKYTYFGDVNIDGQVTGDDYTVIDSNLNTTPPVGIEWLRGDANTDGTVTGDDYTVVDANLNNGVGNPLTPSSLTAVPEPGVGSLVVASLGLLARRRRQKLR
jgi:autotransporter-associated beta strand protein